MKEIAFRCAMASILLLTAFSVFGQERAEAPTYKDGEFWQFRVAERDFIGQTSAALDGEYELAYVAGQLKIFKLGSDQKIDVDAAGIPQQTIILEWMFSRGSYQGGQSLKFPLSIGQKWSYDYMASARGGRKETLRSAEVRAVGIEDVSVPAGTFRSFKLVREATADQLFTYYYSPQVKAIVKALHTFGSGGKREIELIKFGSAR